MRKNSKYIPLPSEANEILKRLNKIVNIGDPKDIVMSNEAPPDAAAYVTSEDADSSGLVKIIRFNPNVVQKYLGFGPNRIGEIDNYTRELVKKEKENQADKSKALEASKILLSEINEKDKDFYQDLQRIIMAFLFFGVTTVHERKHQEGQTTSGEGMFSAFKEEHEAEGAEPEARRKIVDALTADLPMVLLEDDAVSRLLKKSSVDEHFMVKTLVKISEHLDNIGQYEIADEVNDLVSEIIK